MLPAARAADAADASLKVGVPGEQAPGPSVTSMVAPASLTDSGVMLMPATSSVNVWPTGENAQIWRYVSRGTKGPYWIVSKNPSKYPLKFRTDYKPRTTPSGGYKGPGRAFGKIVRPLYVSHPGIKARNFEQHIARWYAPQFRRTMKNAVARATRRANGK